GSVPMVRAPVLSSSTLPLLDVTPTVNGRQLPAVTVPTVKPPRSLNSTTPARVELAANWPVTSLLALSRSMLARARTPRLAAVMVPAAGWVTVPIGGAGPPGDRGPP